MSAVAVRSAGFSWTSAADTGQAIRLLNFGRPSPSTAAWKPARESGRGTFDLLASGDDEWAGRRPTTAGMQIRKIGALLEDRKLSCKALGKLQRELEGYLSRRVSHFRGLATAPGVDTVLAGLEGLGRAVRALGNVPVGEVERMVQAAEEQIAGGRDRMRFF